MKRKVMKTRIDFLDNLRTFAIFLVVVVHCGLVYEQVLQNTWIVVDPDKADWIGLVRMYLDLFIMYTIFFISGYLIPVSVRGKTNREFIMSKVKRILVPWLIAVLTLIPLYKMIFLYSRGLPREAWYTYFHIFQRQGADMYNFANNPTQNWLWFLPVLFLFQLIYLGMYRFRILPEKFSIAGAVSLTLILGVIYGMLISETGLAGWQHGALLDFQRERLLPYFMVFLLGSRSYQNRVFESPKNTRLYIWMNVSLTVFLGVFTAVALNLFFNLIDPGREYYFVSSFVDRTVYYVTALVSMLSFLYILLYTFRFSFNKAGNVMQELNRNSYAVYIIHVVVLGFIGMWLLHWSIPAWTKFIFLTLLTFVVSNGLISGYRKLIRRNVYLKLAGAAAFMLLFFGFTENEKQDSLPPGSVMQIDIDTLPAPEMSLHEAVIRGDLGVIRAHVRAGSDIDEAEPSGGSSPLITAALFGKSKAAQLLIEAGADLHFTNNDGSTALITAAFFGREAIVRMLLDEGADQTIRNKSGSTALDAVTAPFDSVRGIYAYYRQTLGPMGLELNDDELKEKRRVIAGILGR